MCSCGIVGADYIELQNKSISLIMATIGILNISKRNINYVINIISRVIIND